jgi:hypothetical protein
MDKKRSIVIIIILLILLTAAVTLAVYFRNFKSSNGPAADKAATSETSKADKVDEVAEEKIPAEDKSSAADDTGDPADWQNGVDDCAYDGLTYKFPDNWFGGDFAYLNPVEIEYFDKEKYGREPNTAAIGVYDLVEDDSPALKEANYMTLPYSQYLKKIENSRRNTDDATLDIDGKVFRKYDLTDYKEYNGRSYGNVLIFLSPLLINDQGRKINVAFEWHEFPGGQKIEGNSKDIFLKIISTIKFTHQKCPVL